MFELPGFHLNLKTPKHSFDFKSADAALKKKFQSSIGFYDWPKDLSKDLLQSVKTMGQEIRQNHECVILVGIGGSFLGAAALIDALRDPKEKTPQILWLSNVDRTSIDRTLLAIEGKKAALVLISKSGNTVEAMSALFECQNAIASKSIYVITDPEKGELRQLAKTHQWKTLPVPPTIGGRFSVLTAVGLLPLAIAGIDFEAVVEGAKSLRDTLESLSPAENPAYLYALNAFLWTEEKRNIHVLMPYDSGIALIGDWFVQLWAESIGKKRLKDAVAVGFTPIRCLGTTDQHSQLQLFKEGPADKVVGFIDVRDSKQKPMPKGPFVTESFKFLTHHSVEGVNLAASKAVEESLNRSGTPTYRFSFPSLNPKTLGSFLFFQMTACAMAGEVFGVNAFDQPGVEETKTLLRAAL